MEELVNVLSKVVSSDQNELRAAESFLQQAASANLAKFLTELSNVINKPDLPVHIRMAAGLQLKNHLTSKDAFIKTTYQQRWLSLPPEIRNFIKQNVVLAISLEGTRPSAAAQCAAYIAVAEMPNNMWPELIPLLVHSITDANSAPHAIEGSLEALGYICQEIDPRILHAQSNQILTAIIHGMKYNENSFVKLAATTALLNSLEFTSANFHHETERNYIMQVVCEATQSPDVNIQVRALQCLVRIMSLYYEYMENYMRAALFAITLNAMKSTEEEVSLQGIEFWSTICDEEIEMSLLDMDNDNPYLNSNHTGTNSTSEAADHIPHRTSQSYAKGALPFLLPILLETLTKQDENADEDEWNPSKAGSVCLVLMASCCCDAIVAPTLPFITQNISSQNWRLRDGAVMAFGCIMDGPSPDLLKPLVEQALPHIMPMIKDNVSIVRDTTSWAIGRICEFLPDVVLSPNILNPLLSVLVESLNAEPKIAVNICWALSSLVEAAYDMVSSADESKIPETFILSPQYEAVLERLILTTERNDGQHSNLKGAAFEAIAVWLKCCPSDKYPVLLKIVWMMLERLKQVIGMTSNSIHQDTENHMQILEMQSHLCSVLQSSLRKLKPEDLSHIADLLMASLLQMLSTAGPGKAVTSGVQEDILMTISAFIDGYGEKFQKYMEAFAPFLIALLKCKDMCMVSTTAIMVTIDLYRNLGSKMLTYTNGILAVLIELLADPNADKSLKPHIFSCIGDAAIALGPAFLPYVPSILGTLDQASKFKLPSAIITNNGDSANTNTNSEVDESMIEFMNTLRDCCIEAYSGIVHGLAGTLGNSQDQQLTQDGSKPIDILIPYIGNIINFVITIAKDSESSEIIHVHAFSLIGDLCTALGQKMRPFLDNDELDKFFQSLGRVKSKKRRKSIIWANRQVRLVKGQC